MSWGLAQWPPWWECGLQLCSGSSSPRARGQEGRRKWAAGQQVAVEIAGQFLLPDLAPRVLPSAQGHHLHSRAHVPPPGQRGVSLGPLHLIQATVPPRAN